MKSAKNGKQYIRMTNHCRPDCASLHKTNGGSFGIRESNKPKETVSLLNKQLHKYTILYITTNITA